jgi:hypothetical protein
MRKLTKLVAATIVAGTAALSVTPASAWWGGNDYWGGPWGGGPWYGGYPGYGWGGYPYYGGWGGYGYPAYTAPVAPTAPATSTAK